MKKISSGKVREIYEVDDDKLMMVVSDRISAFDFIMPNPVLDKGKILNKLSEFWFNFVSDIIPNDIITTNYEEFPDEFRKEEFKDRSMLVKKLKMLPVECIVRGYITGSGWAEYQKTGTVCNIKLPEGLQECQKLDEPIFTPSTKAELGDHDENISFERCKEILGDELAEKVKNATINIYKKCADYALSKGIIIADTKFEFGLDENGNLVLGDEVLTPDSILTTDVGQNQMWAAHFYDTQKPRKFISSGGLGTMGFGLPAAIGAKVACPEDPVVSINGDGGFLMVCQELATIKDYDIPVIAVVLENRTLGMVYQWQNLLYNGRYSETKLGTSPDFVKLAESFGVNATRITKPGETKEALKSAIKDNEPILLDVIIDKDETLPMVPPGAAIDEMIGEYKLEKDV